MSEDKASKLITKLGKTARLAGQDVWRARCTWVNEDSTFADTRDLWRTALRRVAQQHLMAVGTVASVKRMRGPHLMAWRGKVVRHCLTRRGNGGRRERP